MAIAKGVKKILFITSLSLLIFTSPLCRPAQMPYAGISPGLGEKKRNILV